MKYTDLCMKRYYEKRTPDFDLDYTYPERQDDLRFLEEYVADQYCGRDVLEVAAGTGYWTQFISRKANSILATDITSQSLNLLNQRDLQCQVVTQIVNAYDLGNLTPRFNGLFSGHWLSHIPWQMLKRFFDGLHKQALPGTKVLFVDNTRAQCERQPITLVDDFQNTYQDRKLADGSIHRVLNNFPTKPELDEIVLNVTDNTSFIQLEHYWLYEYEIR